MSLAAERTYLAYIRTAQALLAAGVAVVGALPGAGYESLRRVLGVVLVLIEASVVATARTRWRRDRPGHAARRPLPASRISLFIAAGMAVAAALALVPLHGRAARSTNAGGDFLVLDAHAELLQGADL